MHISRITHDKGYSNWDDFFFMSSKIWQKTIECHIVPDQSDLVPSHMISLDQWQKNHSQTE